MSPRFFDRLQTSSLALGNSINANRVHVTIEIYISSLRSLISHYKATRFGRVHVLIPQNNFETRALYQVPVALQSKPYQETELAL